MNKTSWQMLLAFGSAATMAAACTFSSGGGSGDDDDRVTSGGTPTSGSGGSSGDGGSGTTTEGSTTGSTTGSGGAAGETGETGGTGGTGGTAGTIECLETEDPTGTPAATDNLDPDPSANSCCTLCAAQNCGAELGACYASNPENVCGAEDGEMGVIQGCMIENEALPGLAEGDSDLENCYGAAVEDASSVLCEGAGTVSGTTNELATCLHGDDDGLGGCFEECYTDFDDDDCTYRD
jgi:hypothetical protein